MSSGEKDPLHGITLETILKRLVEKLGFEEMGRRIAVRCFQLDPSIASSLTFLRRTPWARAKTEQLYVDQFGRSSTRSFPSETVDENAPLAADGQPPEGSSAALLGSARAMKAEQKK